MHSCGRYVAKIMFLKKKSTNSSTDSHVLLLQLVNVSTMLRQIKMRQKILHQRPLSDLKSMFDILEIK